MKNNEIKLENFKRLVITGSVIKKYHLKATFKSTGFLYVDESDEIVCYLIIEKRFNDFDTTIKEIYVSKEYKDSDLYEELIKIAIKKFYAKFVTLNQNNTTAIKLFEKHGFKYNFHKRVPHCPSDWLNNYHMYLK